MNRISGQINLYKMQLKQIFSQNNQNYFEVKQLLQQVNDSQNRINNMIQSLEQQRKQNQLRNYVLKTKISPHPDRERVQLAIQDLSKYSERSQDKNIKFVEENICVNCRLQIEIKPIKIYPVYKFKANKRSPSHIIPSNSLKFLIFHVDKKSQTGYFKFTPKLNIHKSSIYTTKIQKLSIAHDLTFSNYQMMKQLLKQSKIHIFLENEHKLIISSCQLELWQFYEIANQNQVEKLQINLQSSLIKKRWTPDTRKLLKFLMIGTNEQMFTLECQLNFQKLIISPEMFQLKQKAHYKRVLVKQPNRSRSPSPTLHRQTAKSLIKTKDKKQVVIILNNKSVRLKISQPNLYQSSSKKLGILKTENMQQPYQIQLQQTKTQIYLKILPKLKEEQSSGYIQIKVDNTIYQITVKRLKIFEIFTLQKSKTLFKSQEDCDKVNGVVVLTNNVYIRPSMQIKISQALYEQKIVHYMVGTYFLKGEATDHYSIYPGSIRDILRVQKGATINFNVDNQWCRNKSQLKLVLTVLKKGKQNIQKNEKAQQHLKDNLIKQTYTQQQIQIHILKYTILQIPLPQIILTLDIQGIGVYSIQTPGLLARNTKYRCYSLDQHILKVCRYQFNTQNQSNQRIEIQLLTQIQFKKAVIIILQNLNKKVTNFIKLILSHRNY